MTRRHDHDRMIALLKVELGTRAARCLLVEAGQAPLPDGDTVHIRHFGFHPMRRYSNYTRRHSPQANCLYPHGVLFA